MDANKASAAAIVSAEWRNLLRFACVPSRAVAATASLVAETPSPVPISGASVRSRVRRVA
jgi:hypothetical protein